MATMQDQSEKVKELFGQLTAEIPGTNRFRAINEEGFKMAIDIMMNEAFYLGQLNAVETTKSVFSKVFTQKV